MARGTKTSGGSLGCDDVTLSYMKEEESFYEMSAHKLLKEDFAPWS